MEPFHTLQMIHQTGSTRTLVTAIGRRLAVQGAPHSPDLTPTDFYLWGDLKDVYRGRPRSIAEHKATIIDKIC